MALVAACVMTAVSAAAWLATLAAVARDGVLRDALLRLLGEAPAAPRVTLADLAQGDARWQAAVDEARFAAEAGDTPASGQLPSPATAEDATLALTWGTPLLRARLAGLLPEVAEADQDREGRVLARLAARVGRAYAAVAATAARDDDDGHVSGHSAASANQLFFDWQVRAGGWTAEFADDADVRAVVAAANTALDALLRGVGREDLVADRVREPTEIWATYHERGSYHRAHNHGRETLCAVVVYILIPASGAGKLLLEDPRGPRPPFEDRVEIYPTTGDVIVFPGWLQHAVEPGQQQQHDHGESNDTGTATPPRISIAMNFPAVADETSDGSGRRHEALDARDALSTLTTRSNVPLTPNSGSNAAPAKRWRRRGR